MQRYILAVLVFFQLHVLSQEKMGIANSNYSGVNSIFLNPSSSADCRTYLQLHLVGANAFAVTNLAYLPDFYAWNFSVPQPTLADLPFQKFVYANAGATGPVFMVTKGNIGAGLFVRARTVANVRRLPHQLTSLITMQDPVGPKDPELDVKNAGFSSMTWLEYGANFSYIFRKERTKMMMLGVNARYIAGINGVYANLAELRGRFGETSIAIDRLRGKVRFNEFALNSGRGYAIDVGFTFKKMLFGIDAYLAHSQRSNCRFIDYKYKIGLALRDAGYVKFTKTTYTADYDGSGYFGINRNDPSTRQLNYLNVQTEIGHGPFTMLMPSTFVGQFDYNFENYFYLNATVVKNLVPGRITGVQGTDLLAVTPRLEMKNIEVAVPLSLQKFFIPQVGFALRFRSLVVGVENVIPVFIAKNTYGLGVYFNLGVSVFKNPTCKSRTSNVDDCGPGNRIRSNLQKNFWRKIFGRNKTYSK
jgi:hypothetical protein